MISALSRAAHAQPAASTLSQRLDGVAAAVERQLAAVPGDTQAYPADLRRIAWLRMAGDRFADALVVLKPRKDDCAVVAKSARPCKALILIGAEDGSFGVATEFPFLVHPLLFRQSPAGYSEMYYSRDTQDQPRYSAFVFRAGEFVRDGPERDWAGLQGLPSFVTDDRSLPTLAEQRYAAEQFDNRRAKLAPFRIHLDAINQSGQRLAENETIYDSAFADRAQFLVEGLAPDVAKVVAGIGWAQTLEVRVWSCLDWMVPRRFWEIEDRRPGRIGLCADPLVFGLRQGLIRSNAEYLQAARYRLLQEIGIAYLLRSANVTHAQRTAMKKAEAVGALVESGAIAGLVLGQALNLQTLDEAQQAQALWRRLSNQWFGEFENKTRGFVIRSPELKAYDADLDVSDAVLRCFPRPGAARAANCGKSLLDGIESIRSSIRLSLAP